MSNQNNERLRWGALSSNDNLSHQNKNLNFGKKQEEEDLCATPVSQRYVPDLKLNHSKSTLTTAPNRANRPGGFPVRLRVHGTRSIGRFTTGFSTQSQHFSGRFGTAKVGGQSSAVSSSQYFSDSGTSFKTGLMYQSEEFMDANSRISNCVKGVSRSQKDGQSNSDLNKPGLVSNGSPSVGGGGANQLSSIMASQQYDLESQSMSARCYQMEAPQPNFLSQSDWAGLEEVLDEQHDERKIIRYINNSDLSSLTSVLAGTNLDITKIVDENGFTLVHLAAYVNSEACLKALFDHLESPNYASDFFVFSKSHSKNFKEQMSGYNKIIIKEWVNRATKVTKGSQLDILSQMEMLEHEQDYGDS